MRVLMVEDEVLLAQTVSRGLVAEGFVVDVVHDGAEGLQAARSTGYDVVILDIMLPALNGYDVCRGLRAGGIWAESVKSSETVWVSSFRVRGRAG